MHGEITTIPLPESEIDITQVLADIDSGAINEVLGCGTAPVIAPVGRLDYLGEDHVINSERAGLVAGALLDTLTIEAE